MDKNTPFGEIVFNATREEAKKFLRISSKYSSIPEIVDHIAYLQSSIKDYEGSIDTLSRLLKSVNDVESAYAIQSNLATLYNKVNDPIAALKYLDSNARISNSVEIELEKSLSHYFLGDYKKSEEILNNLLHQDITEDIRNRVLYNLAIYEIEKGNFKKGYLQYIDKGHRIKVWPTQQQAMIPLWKGEVEPGKTILIHGEGGIGDEIIGIRFAKLIQQLGMVTVWKTNNKDLKTVFNRNGYKTILSMNELEADNVAQCMAMYLPALLDLDANEIWNEVYLTPDQSYIEKWKKLLPAGDKIAVRWQGNMHYDQDLHRSIPKESIERLNYKGTKISVQIDDSVEWAFNPEINTIEDTLAILSLCNDGLITSCTSVAHMAAAIGVRTIVCPPIAYYYVWAENSRWYGDHVTIIKQKNHKDWDSVISQVQRKIDDK